MRRWALYVLILIAVLVLPAKRIDIGKLEPVETIAIYRDDGNIVIATDTGDYGRGTDARQALGNLKKTTPGVIYLDTAAFLLITEDTCDAAAQLRDHFNDGVELCLFQGSPDLKLVSKFLSVHSSGTKLKNWKKGDSLPVLECTEERLNFR